MSNEREELLRKVAIDLGEQNCELADALRAILDELPGSRDWMNPKVERQACLAIKNATGEDYEPANRRWM